jgi:hypothetical protein
MGHRALVIGLGAATGDTTVTVAVLAAVCPLSSATLQVTVMGPVGAPEVISVAVEPDPLTEPEVELKLYINGRFCGLIPVAVIVEELPEITVEGSAMQLTVGGSNALTTYGTVQSAFSEAFVP